MPPQHVSTTKDQQQRQHVSTMGIVGLTRLLKQEGWLPSSESTTTSLWCDENDDTTILGPSNFFQVIPAGSTLAIDGNGLAFHLHRVAYTRHYNTITSNQHLSEIQRATLLLPHCMPLSLLHDVTVEFCTAFQQADLFIKVYWDGPSRRLKSETTVKRRQARDSEWCQLKNYCVNGILPFDAKQRGASPQQWLANFPYSKLFLAQVRYSMLKCGVEMEYCSEEADATVARASASHPNTFSVGNDSDYCIYRNCKYVPLDTLSINNNQVSGIVITRDVLADHFNLPHPSVLVELALCMGNDFITKDMVGLLDHNISLNGKTKSRSEITEMLEHLQSVDSEYRVSSSTPQVQLAINFSRDLYNLQNVSHYPLDNDRDVDVDGGGKEDSETHARSCRDDSVRIPKLPSVQLQPTDISIRAVACRQLQQYLDDQSDVDMELFTPRHLEAFQQMFDHTKHGNYNHKIKGRPSWQQVVAAFTIEGLLAWILKSNPASLHPAVRLTSPAKIFSHMDYYAALQQDEHRTQEDATPKQEQEYEPELSLVLPIDEHKEIILKTIESQRVTIIQGETGCGKSSRVPCMLLRNSQNTKLFISQPRRIAAKSLVERIRSCEPDLRHAVALRMGHGVREYESEKTRAWFVTTGYLVRLQANHPEKFQQVTHLVVDEVHERSVDTDILCLLCKRLLQTNQTIKLVLMSATMAASLYQAYFGVPQPPIFVGARRFPIQEYFVQDLHKALPSMPPTISTAIKSITAECERTRCRSAPPTSYMEKLYQLAVHVTTCVGRPGSSVLVFVPGMMDIVSITDLLERVYIPSVRFTCFPIHSDVPFEEQMAAFDLPHMDEVKVVIATNAAESSVTLPNVDHVVCLGLCKQVVYNARSHRQALQPCWISRASAVQRAGRTGRVREGHVYRLYTQTAMELYMEQFEPGEMLRIPLDSVILTLKEMLKEEATPVLLDCLEPPDLTTIDRSFQSLCSNNFITQPNDGGDITSLGSFVIALGIDLALGSLIGLGIQFGVAAEAMELAAVLSFPKTPWIMTNPLYHDAAEYNDITARTFVSKCHFDAGLKSEPFAIMNMMWDYEQVSNKNGWCRYYSLSAQRVRRLVATRNSIQSRVSDLFGIHSDLVHVQVPPVRMEHAKLTILRLIQVWVFSEGIIESPPLLKTQNADSFTVKLSGTPVKESHLEQILDTERHPYTLVSDKSIEQFGTFTPVGGPMSPQDFQNTFLVEFEGRFVSYAIENGFSMFWYQTDSSLQIFALKNVADSNEFAIIREQVLPEFQESVLVCEESTNDNRRGRKGRACGNWSIRCEGEPGNDAVTIVKWSANKASKVKKVVILKRLFRQIPQVSSVLSCALTKSTKQPESPRFIFNLHGECSKISNTDIGDMFATPYVNIRERQSSKFPQSITFSDMQGSPLPAYDGKTDSELSTADDCKGSSWHRPLLHDIPEGARLLSVVASGRRKDHFIRLSSFESDSDVDENEMACQDLDISLSPETKISKRWRQFSSDLGVFVTENNVPAAAACMKKADTLYACCANILELRGGSLKAEGVTLLPPGRLFVLLSLLTFGLPTPGPALDFEEKKEDTEEDSESDFDPKMLSLLSWLHSDDTAYLRDEDSLAEEERELDSILRMEKARQFHKSCEELGESLVCYPEKVKALLEIFDTVDGYSALPWEDLNEDPFTEINIKLWREDYKRNRSTRLIASIDTTQQGDSTGRQGSTRGVTNRVSGKRYFQSAAEGLAAAMSTGKRSTCLVAEMMETLPKELLARSSRLFAIQLPDGESVGEMELPSTNILSIVLQKYCNAIVGSKLMSEDFKMLEGQGKMDLTDRHWNVYSVVDEEGKEWHMADFVNSLLPFLPLRGRGKPLPRWITSCLPRPTCSQDALACVPPQFSTVNMLETEVSLSGVDETVVLFDNVELALRMEAAFWLEHQFAEPRRRWYQQTLEELLGKALASLPLS